MKGSSQGPTHFAGQHTRRRTKMTKIKTRLAQMAVATILATGLLVVAQIDSSDATFSGKNGVIAFEGNRTTGKSVHNPTRDTKTFVSERDGDFEVTR
jgi:hypothetical protein